VSAATPSPRAGAIASAPPGYTCTHYDALPGSKRCRHYVERGACALPTEFMCVEWMKANGQGPAPKPAAPAPVQPERPRPVEEQPRDLFGHPLAPPPAVVPAKPKPVEPKRPTEPEATVDLDQLRGVTTEDIESFKALGVEVLLHSETYGDVWLVPAYTGRERKEITPEHAATLARVMSVFPGSHIVSFEKTAKTNNPERRERPLEERS